jgi:IclR family transcriptional regulator, KDG regulon repressor
MDFGYSVEKGRGKPIQAVGFALHLLEFVAQRQGSVGVSEMAREFGTTKSRIHRHLQTLVAAGYLARNPDSDRYFITARLVALGQAVSESFDAGIAAREVARALRDRLGHAVTVSLPDPEGARIILLMSSRSNIEIAVKPGSVLPFHASAQGKIFLAFGEPQVLGGVMRQGLPMATPYTITDPQRLLNQLGEIRRNGWATAPNEVMVGLNALAAPISDALGKLVGSIAITDSVQHIPETPSMQQLEAVRDAARQISENLGNRGQHTSD